MYFWPTDWPTTTSFQPGFVFTFCLALLHERMPENTLPLCMGWAGLYLNGIQLATNCLVLQQQSIFKVDKGKKPLCLWMNNNHPYEGGPHILII